MRITKRVRSGNSSGIDLLKYFSAIQLFDSYRLSATAPVDECMEEANG